MKKFSSWCLLFLFVLQTHSLLADYNCSVTARLAAFFPTSHRFQKIYDVAITNYQIEAATKLCGFPEICGIGGDWEGWVNVDWLSKHGTSLGYRHRSTNIRVVNGSFGVKFNFCSFTLDCLPNCLANCFTPYVGIGPLVGKVRIHNKTRCEGRHTSTKWTAGAVVKSGINYVFCDGFFVDAFLDYVYETVSFRSNTNIGGFKLGAGLGYKF